MFIVFLTMVEIKLLLTYSSNLEFHILFIISRAANIQCSICSVRCQRSMNVPFIKYAFVYCIM